MHFLVFIHKYLIALLPMFVISELEDDIEISAASPDKRAAVLDKLKTKYTSVLIESLGLAVFVSRIVEIVKYAIKSDKLVAHTIFEVVFYRFYQNEIVFGKILKQDEDKILVGDEFHNTYEIVASDLFENCEFLGDETDGKWIWNYKGNQLPFETGDRVLIRIKRLKFDSGIVEAYVNDQGLGPVSWWE